MHILYKLGFTLSTVLFGSLLLTVGLLLAIIAVFATPTHIKQGLDESGLHEALVDGMIDSTGNSVLRNLPLDDPALRAVFTDTLRPPLETGVRGGIDNFYAWLQGDVEEPTLALDFASAREPLGERIEAYAAAFLADLPACPAGTMPFVFSPFHLDCLPRDVDVTTTAQEVRQEVVDEIDSWSESAVGFRDISDGEEVHQTVPNIYQATLTSFWILLGATLLAGAAIVLLAARTYQGLRTLGITSLAVGVLLLAIAFGTSILIGQAATNMAMEGNGPLEEAAPALLQYLGSAVYTWWLWSGVILGAAGIGLIVGAAIVKRRS